MTSTVFKIIYRNLIRNPAPSIINLLGFSTAIAVAFLIISYVHHELSFEKYHGKAERICRINLGISIEGEKKMVAMSPNILGPRMKDQIPEVENYVRMSYPINSTPVIKVEDTFFKEKEFYMADSSLFDVFTFELIKGDKKRLLTGGEDAMISGKSAIRLYGTTDVVDNTFIDSHGNNYVVRAVFDDHPENSHFKPEIIVSSLSGRLEGELTWGETLILKHLRLKKKNF